MTTALFDLSLFSDVRNPQLLVLSDEALVHRLLSESLGMRTRRFIDSLTGGSRGGVLNGRPIEIEASTSVAFDALSSPLKTL